MHVAVKVLIGLILIIIGLALFVLSPMAILGYTIDWIKNFVILVTGIIPIFLIILGLFVVWLELDELKAQRELAREEVKEVKK
jgi:hypothetical protein